MSNTNSKIKFSHTYNYNRYQIRVDIISKDDKMKKNNNNKSSKSMCNKRQ